MDAVTALHRPGDSGGQAGIAGCARARDGGAVERGATVSLVELEKQFDSVGAVRGISLEIGSGEFLTLLGPSGSGKTTTLMMIAGFETPTGGDIAIDGRSVIGTPPHRRNIGMVFQNYALFPYLTVAQNIAFPLKMRNLPRREVAQRVERALEMVRLAGFGARMPAQLSGGQQQRVALARAAVYDPPVLLMDEPLGALDKNLREDMQEELRQFHHDVGATIIYVTHDQQEAASMADRIAIMNHGRVEQVGPPHEVYERPANGFVARFLGEANMLPLARTDAVGEACARCITEAGLTVLAAAPRAGTVLCIRPEDITIDTAPISHPNQFAGRITDVMQAAGSVRYRVAISPACCLTVRAQLVRRTTVLPVDTEVHVGWDADDVLVLPD